MTIKEAIDNLLMAAWEMDGEILSITVDKKIAKCIYKELGVRVGKDTTINYFGEGGRVEIVKENR